MRRRTPLGIIIAAVLLVLAAGGYTAFWFILAGKLKEGLAQWAESAKAQQIDVRWRAVRVGGFPLAFTIDLADAVLREEATNPATEIRLPRLSGSAHPWNLRVWKLDAAEGLNATAERLPMTLAAKRARGALSLGGDGGAAIWLGLDAPTLETQQVSAQNADVWLILPPHSPIGHTDTNLALAADLHALTLPEAPRPLRNLLDELAFGLTVKGAIPSGPARQAAAAWRDAGGTAELDNFRLRWGQVVVTGSGTLALDSDLQPIGGFSGAVEGYEELMNALVAAGRMKAGEARIARIGLAMLAKAGPDGRPAITTSFTIQNGEMLLGPAKLGPAPRINWE